MRISVHITRFILLFCFTLSCSVVQAQGWKAVLPQESSLPPGFLGIDKSKQELFYFEQFSPLRVVHNFRCSTGQVEGDKFEEGDLRTPEGIYFMERKLDSGLNYELYGDIAFTLNFPNPVDRIRGKNGYGIWVHGRGTPIVPRETKGCVALNNGDLETLTPEVKLGMTPVAIAREMDIQGDTTLQNDVFARLHQLVRDWERAWEGKSPAYLAMYDPDKFALSSGTPFEHFAARKKRLFSQYPWIEVLTHDVRILPGPGYWVTYFGQYFVTPTFRTEGIKRLYWQQGEGGGLKIVGSEWVGGNLGLEDLYLKKLEERIRPWLEEWRQAWLKADNAAYISFYSPGAVQDGLRGVDRIQAHKELIWADNPPQRIGVQDIRVDLGPEGIRITFEQEYRSAGGYADQGTKTLILEPAGNGEFTIISEQWRAG